MTRDPRATSPVLELIGITKRFGPVAANQDIDLALYPGEIHALLGENGAGKSTLMSILSGRLKADSGEIRVRGQRTILKSPADALARGIGMVHQRFMLVDRLTVVENVILGRRDQGPLLSLDRAASELSGLSRAHGLDIDPRKRVRDLSMGERQRVEILKLLLRDTGVLIFDEPTSILTPPEVASFFEVLWNLAAQGRSIIFISHKLEEVMALADRISIMRRGRMVARDLLPDEMGGKAELARLMVGREVVLQVDKEPIPPGPPVLEIRGLASRTALGEVLFEDIDLEVRRGEILALTGVAGNGQESLTAVLAGLAPFSRGEIVYQDRSWSHKTWAASDLSSTAYIPADRDRTGSLPAMTLTANFLLTRLNEFRIGPFMSLRRAASTVDDAITDHDIKTPSGSRSIARQLSGGNLQKFLLARELGKAPRLVIAEQPTQGLDIGATEDVWRALLGQRKTAGILLVSGDLKEVLSLADRIAVMFRGRILKTFSVSDADMVARIGLLMAGVTDEAPELLPHV